MFNSDRFCKCSYVWSDGWINKSTQYESCRSSNSLSVDTLNDPFWDSVEKVMAKIPQHIWKTPFDFYFVQNQFIPIAFSLFLVDWHMHCEYTNTYSGRIILIHKIEKWKYKRYKIMLIKYPHTYLLLVLEQNKEKLRKSSLIFAGIAVALSICNKPKNP